MNMIGCKKWWRWCSWNALESVRCDLVFLSTHSACLAINLWKSWDNETHTHTCAQGTHAYTHTCTCTHTHPLTLNLTQFMQKHSPKHFSPNDTANEGQDTMTLFLPELSKRNHFQSHYRFNICTCIYSCALNGWQLIKCSLQYLMDWIKKWV